MLTKQDLQQIGEIVEAKARTAVREELKPIKREIRKIKDSVEDLEIKLEEKAAELYKEIFLTRAELKEILKISSEL